MLRTANPHLIKPAIIVSQARNAGLAGYIASVETIPMFSSKSKNQAPTGASAYPIQIIGARIVTIAATIKVKGTPTRIKSEN